MRQPAAPESSRNDPIDEQLLPTVITDLQTSALSLPTREAAQNLVKAYFQFANLSQPLLYEPHLQEMVESLYNIPSSIDFGVTHSSGQAKLATFFVLEVFAVALMVLQKQDPSRIPTSVADRYHQMALTALAEIGLPHSVNGVQALLLISQYFYHHPTNWGTWKTVGAALRLAVELGFHHDPLPDQMDFLTVDIRRRTFWVAYALDRNISIALGRPSGLPDGAIYTEVCISSGDR
jgi:hypothetical protein